MDANGTIYRAPEDQIPVEDRARHEGYLIGKAENELEVSRLALQLATERERVAEAAGERAQALVERDEAEARLDTEEETDGR